MFFFKNYPKFVRNKLGTAMFNCVAFKAKILVILSQSFEFEEVNEFEVNPFPISFCITGVEVFRSRSFEVCSNDFENQSQSFEV